MVERHHVHSAKADGVEAVASTIIPSGYEISANGVRDMYFMRSPGLTSPSVSLAFAVWFRWMVWIAIMSLLSSGDVNSAL